MVCYTGGVNRHSQEGGFVLLVEAVVAFSIFLVAAFTFYGTMANASRAEAKARQTVAATAFARELLETQRAVGYEDLLLGEESGRISLDTVRGDARGVIDISYRVNVRTGPGKGLKSVKVEVGWKDGRIDLETYVAR